MDSTTELRTGHQRAVHQLQTEARVRYAATRKHSLPFVRGIHQSPVSSPRKGSATRYFGGSVLLATI